MRTEYTVEIGKVVDKLIEENEIKDNVIFGLSEKIAVLEQELLEIYTQKLIKKHYTIHKKTYLKTKRRRRQIAQYDDNGKLVKIHDSVQDAMKALGRLSSSQLYHYANKDKKAWGYYWRYVYNSTEKAPEMI